MSLTAPELRAALRVSIIESSGFWLSVAAGQLIHGGQFTVGKMELVRPVVMCDPLGCKGQEPNSHQHEQGFKAISWPT